MDNIKTGKLIRVIRTEKGITQRELAKQLNVSNAAVSKWENGHGFPDISLLEPLADALGITVTELVSGCRAEKNACNEDPAKDIITLSQNKKVQTNKEVSITTCAVTIILILGFLLIVYIAPLRTIAPQLTGLKGSITLNLLAIGLGLAAWACAGMGIGAGRHMKAGLWRSYSICSFALCSISLWIPLLMTGYSRMEEIIMFLDTMGGYNFGGMILLFVTLVLNLTSCFLNRNH